MKILLACVILASVLPSWSLPHPQAQPQRKPLSSGWGFHATKKGVAEVGVTAAGLAGLGAYAVMKAKYDQLQELWNSKKARLDVLEQRYESDTVHSIQQTTRLQEAINALEAERVKASKYDQLQELWNSKKARLDELEQRYESDRVHSIRPSTGQQDEINALQAELAKARKQLEDYPGLLEAHEHAVDRASKYGELLDQFHDTVPVRQLVANRMVGWLPPRDLPDKVMECAYGYLFISIYSQPRIHFQTVTASEWEEALNECSRWHGYPAPKDWGLKGTGEVQISRSMTRHTEHAMQEGQGQQVRAAADARKKARDQDLNFQQHAESGVKTQAPFHVSIPAWVTREFKHVSKEAKAAGALRWSRMAEEGKALEVSAIRSGV
ncbi:MAG: hypothetical protein M1826_006888 [Phylliscum demangeonii]|nr:MAG: hypothetical protein M1826_006888 [Phylliscum demangeonii]